MIKSHESLSEAIRNPKHPFVQIERRQLKAQKHRYERRKVRQFLHNEGLESDSDSAMD